jgi:4'-phosphopantetheinyl transferase
MHLPDGEVHIYAASLQLPSEQLSVLFPLMSQDEQERALRFHFTLHQQRFIAAHGILRLILSWYLDVAPETIVFGYSDHHKPFLLNNALNIHFNLSHSEDYALYAVTRVGEIGVDVEKIRPDDDKADVAQRFFSASEKSALFALPGEEQTTAFYRLWSGKEAIIKASGKGLSQPLASFSVSFNLQPELIHVDGKKWHLYPFDIHPEFASACALAAPVSGISIYDFIDQKSIIRSKIQPNS